MSAYSFKSLFAKLCTEQEEFPTYQTRTLHIYAERIDYKFNKIGFVFLPQKRKVKGGIGKLTDTFLFIE